MMDWLRALFGREPRPSRERRQAGEAIDELSIEHRKVMNAATKALDDRARRIAENDRLAAAVQRTARAVRRPGQ